MTKVALLKFLFLLIFVPATFAQKVKYKDIYALLSTKQYEAAEPFLKSYLRETADNPNAYLFMGIVYQEKAAKDDVLKHTSRMIGSMDTAIVFYDKAYKSITEKEIKKNSEYYQAYNRRDLRTGEFGVKLSDIQFDLEKRMEGLRERIDRVKMVKYYFSMSDSLYKRSNALYASMQSTYPGEKEFYLRADENVLKKLDVLTLRFDSCTKAFSNYKSSLAMIGKSGYNQTLSLKEITDFKNDGAAPANFYADDLQVWDYNKFVTKASYAIVNDILPTREHLVSYDIEINKLREKLSKDSISVRSDLTSLVDKLLMKQLKEYDKAPLPIELFTLKIADLEYRSTLIENKRRQDTTDVHIKLGMLNKEMKCLTKLDSIATKLSAEDLDSRSLDYDYFVKNTFANTATLKSFISGMKEYAGREIKVKQQQLTRKNESLRWIVNGADSIPLFNEGQQSRYKPLVIMDEKYTAGLHYVDSLNPSGYLYTINPSRIPEVKVSFPVEKGSFRQSQLSSSKAIAFSDAAGQLYFILIYSEVTGKEDKIAATLAKIYKSDGLAWSANYQLAFVPREMQFKPESGELTIKGENDQQNTMDKNGKVLK